MLFSDENFDDQTRAALTRALEDAWIEVRAALATEPLDPSTLRERLAMRITAAARRGERDAKKLKMVALGIV